MKTKKENTGKKKFPKNFKINPALTDKYADQPFFKDKVDRANHILKTVGLPKFEANNKKSTAHKSIAASGAGR